jgi:hypothetical protein
VPQHAYQSGQWPVGVLPGAVVFILVVQRGYEVVWDGK